MNNKTRIEKIEKWLEGRYMDSDYPALQLQFEDWSITKPFEGLEY